MISVGFLLSPALTLTKPPQPCLKQIQSGKTGRIYYVDIETGNDNATGLSPALAWRSLAKLNATLFLPGDQILFKSRQSWVGQLHPQGTGSKHQPIIISSYGSGSKPVIAGNGVANGTIFLYNQSCWEIKNLEITNYNAAEEDGITLNEWESLNKTRYALPILPPQLLNYNVPKYGIYVVAQDTGAIEHLHLINLDVHGVNGFINQKKEQSKNNGGIFFEVTGTLKPTYFDDVLIDSCQIHDLC